jgi:hypothetical protein
MNSAFSLGLFQTSIILYASLFISACFAILFIPSLLVPGAKAEGVGKAITCYLIKTLGLILVASSVTQLIYGMLTLNFPSYPQLAALIFVMVVGVGMMIHMSRVLETVDDQSETIPRLVFCHTLEVLGALVTVVSGLSVALSFMLTQAFSGWESSATMILLGLLMMLTSSVAVSRRNRLEKKGKKK